MSKKGDRMPKIVDATQQRREICRAARGVFARRGVHGTGLSHVAKAAGMGRSSLYHYFPDKDALVRALIREQMRDEEALFAAALAGEGSPLARIESLAAGQVAIFEQWRATAGLTLDLWSRHARRFRPFFRRLRAQLGSLIAEGQAAGEIDETLSPELCAASLVGVIDGLLLQYVVEPAALGEPELLRAHLVDSVRRQLAA
jgi:TetR/AcrR family transcriptional repressor of uid operon